MRATLYRLERSSERMAIGRPSTLRGSDGKPVDVQIEDLSATGCRLGVPLALHTDEEVMIGLPGVGMRSARVIWTEAGQAGFAFSDPISFLEVEETRAADPLTHVDFRPFPSSCAITRPETEKGFTPRWRLGLIVVAAVGAWIVMTGVGKMGYFLLASTH
jgi:hypothetical protein